mgnify:CR=1 FL=1
MCVGLTMSKKVIKVINVQKGKTNMEKISTLYGRFGERSYSLFVYLDDDKSVNYEIRFSYSKNTKSYYISVYDCLCKKSESVQDMDIVTYNNLMRNSVRSVAAEGNRYSKKQLAAVINDNLGNHIVSKYGQFSALVVSLLSDAQYLYQSDDFNKYEVAA